MKTRKTARDYLPEVDTTREFSFEAVNSWSRKLGTTVALEGEWSWDEIVHSSYRMDGTTAAGRMWFLRHQRYKEPVSRLDPIKAASPGYLSFLHQEADKRAHRLWERDQAYANKIRHQYQPIWDELEDAGFYEKVVNLDHGSILDEKRGAVRWGMLGGFSVLPVHLHPRRAEADVMSDIVSETEYQDYLGWAEAQLGRLTNPEACKELQRLASLTHQSWCLRGDLFGRLKRSVAPYMPPPAPLGKHGYVMDEDVQEIHIHLLRGNYLRFITNVKRRMPYHDDDYNWSLVATGQFKQYELNFNPEKGPVEPFAYPKEP